MKPVLKQLNDSIARKLRAAQLRVCRSYPPICREIAIGAFQKRQGHIQRPFLFAVRIPRALFLHLRDKRKKRVVLAHVSFMITTRCTLCCDRCVVHIPDLKSHCDMPVDELLSDIQALFSCVDYVYNFVLFGGEPFLHPNLEQIVHACAALGKIGTIIINTNGTVVPNAQALMALRDASVRVNISKYKPELQPNIENLKAALAENKIKYYAVPSSGDYWFDLGVYGELKEGNPAQRFRDCSLGPFHAYISGQLHQCCPSAVLMHDERIPDCKEDYIDLRTVSPAAFRDALTKLHKRPVLSACSYCLGQTYETPKIPVAVQRVPANHDKEPPK